MGRLRTTALVSGRGSHHVPVALGDTPRVRRQPSCVPTLLAAVALCCAASRSVGQVVDLSLNVFPTNLALPNAGGTWNIVAKTSGGATNLGIAAISAFLPEGTAPGALGVAAATRAFRAALREA